MTALAPVIRVGNKTPVKTVIRTKGHKTVKERKKNKNQGKTLYCKAAKTNKEIQYKINEACLQMISTHPAVGTWRKPYPSASGNTVQHGDQPYYSRNNEYY